MTAHNSTPQHSRKISRYEVLREIGRGGMAIVYIALDPNFQREVAIKVLPREAMQNAALYERFVREARTIASLEHPAIVPVHDFGEDQGQPFFVMRYLGGGSLSDRITKGPMSVSETAKVMERIGSALDAAHAKGIVHRDLKPQNILFDTNGEAYLGDFGIAQLSSVTSPLTGSGVVGTPAYMSPEQIRGGDQVDGRADIYSLGVVVFEMLTGSTPFKADTPAQLMMMQLANPIPHLTEYRKDVPPVLNEVLIRAMAKDRELRFSNASDFIKGIAQTSQAGGREKIEETGSTIDDLGTGNRLPRGWSGSAQGESTPKKKTKQWITWLGAGLMMLCLCLSLVGGGIALNNNPVFLKLFSSTTSTVSEAIPSTEAVKIIATNTPMVIVKTQEKPTETATMASSGDTQVFDTGGNLEAFAFSPDGSKLATGGMGDGSIRIWNTQDWSLLKIMQAHTNKVVYLSWSPKDAILVSGGDDGKLIVWNMDTYEEKTRITGTDNFRWGSHMKWSEDGSLFGIATVSQLYYFRNTQFNKMYMLDCNLCIIENFKFSPNNLQIATGNSMVTSGATIKFWDTLSGKRNENMLTNSDIYTLGDISYSPDGKKMVAVGAKSNPFSSQAWIWDIGTNLVTIPASQPKTGSVLEYIFWINEGFEFITVDNVGVIIFWDAMTGESGSIYRLEDLGAKVSNPGFAGAVFLPDKNHIALGYFGGEIVIWKMPDT